MDRAERERHVPPVAASAGSFWCTGISSSTVTPSAASMSERVDAARRRPARAASVGLVDDLATRGRAERRPVGPGRGERAAAPSAAPTSPTRGSGRAGPTSVATGRAAAGRVVGRRLGDNLTLPRHLAGDSRSREWSGRAVAVGANRATALACGARTRTGTLEGRGVHGAVTVPGEQ